MVGFFGGLFAVPLNALLQQKSGDEEKGRLMATNNFLNMLAILVASAALWLCRDIIGLTADRIILVFGVLTLLASIYVLSVVPEFLVRFCLWLLTHTIYRIRIEGQEHVPSRGPALLVCNHLSQVAGAVSLPRHRVVRRSAARVHARRRSPRRAHGRRGPGDVHAPGPAGSARAPVHRVGEATLGIVLHRGLEHAGADLRPHARGGA